MYASAIPVLRAAGKYRLTGRSSVTVKRFKAMSRSARCRRTFNCGNASLKTLLVHKSIRPASGGVRGA